MRLHWRCVSYIDEWYGFWIRYEFATESFSSDSSVDSVKFYLKNYIDNY